MSEETNTLSENELASLLTIYQIAHDQWEHAEQLRWTVLYNFLVASTILLLGWGAAFQATAASPRRTLVLLTLCIVGVLVSVVWVGLEERANRFVKYHSIKAAKLEAPLPPEWRLFAATQAFRTSLEGYHGRISTRCAVVFIPLTFLALFVILGCLSLGA